ncbi:efflux RND transporter periplasmic adaptor subunit [Pseudotabrizicola sediminis]|uniref:Efflux RND transporter periplasmic adaptor subunit n=1 Tax=Pseudotabrizicola sediminis TaxID=2486418 RepID=A0ABY2KMG2_9RHOB|nr:efflux RND transporter periplasmic adaptor subunit [Pseudotabrizicola sediminis]TGD42117.1 efflux RND transporter periplasmic adaptor subunit [Pseudotabrizicola sediminis]
MAKRLIIAVILLGLIVGGIVWFNSFRAGMIAQFMAGRVPPPVPVTVQMVEPVTWTPGIDAIGTAVSARGVDLAIESGGLVRAVNFTSNDKVTEGQMLLQIDDDSERASLAAAEAALGVTQTESQRAETLTERGVGTANSVETALAQVESARAQVAQVRTALDAKTLTAPFDGVVGIPRVERGQYVTPGTVYATLQDLDQMYVDFTVPEQQIGALDLGRAISVSTEVADFQAEGRITGIEPQVDPRSRLVSVRAAVDNTNGGLFPGQFLRVRVALPEEQGVITVPQTAVISSLYGDSIYVVMPEGEGLKVNQAFVTLGRRSGDRIEVVAGIAAGDQIVTSGQNRLSNAASVVIDDTVQLSPAVTAPAATPPAEPASGEADATGDAAAPAAASE